MFITTSNSAIGEGTVAPGGLIGALLLVEALLEFSLLLVEVLLELLFEEIALLDEFDEYTEITELFGVVLEFIFCVVTGLLVDLSDITSSTLEDTKILMLSIFEQLDIIKIDNANITAILLYKTIRLHNNRLAIMCKINKILYEIIIL